ncbi:MAG: hypothetical protein JW742_01055 [Candidatus Aminicenantes bacterium]|nr:hypothetical protein [Candidatus Aminicenantes bacterium]
MIAGLTVLAALALLAGGSGAGTFAGIQDQEAALEGLDTSKPPLYSPSGRRDPFKDLLAGKEFKERAGAGEISELAIDDMVLKGIVKHRGKLTAILGGPQGFPLFVQTGTRFTDGYILSLTETQIVFRKVSERGMPLMRPKDIVKEIVAEER